jgi:hypothetical protein
VRHSRSTKQRVWLGPGRYLCGCERRIANTNAYSHSDGNSDTNGNGNADSNPNREPHCNSIGNGYAATDANTQVGPIGKAASHSSAETVTVFAKAGIVARSATSDERSVLTDFAPLWVAFCRVTLRSRLTTSCRRLRSGRK